MNDTIESLLQSDSLVAGLDTISLLVSENDFLQSIPRVTHLSNIPYIGVMMLVMSVLLLFTIAHSRKQFIFTLRNFFTVRTRSMAYDPETSEWWVSTILWANVLFSYALFVLIAVGHRLDAVLLSNSMLLLIVVGFIGLYLLFHWLIFRLMGYIFRLNMAAESYSKAYFTVISGLGIVLFPIATCLIYLPQHSENYLLMIGYIFIALAIVLLLIKSIQIFYSKIASLFYIILYFCTLEILPILITIKVIFLLL